MTTIEWVAGQYGMPSGYVGQWHLLAAMDVYQKFKGPFHDAGYLLLIYGSILEGGHVPRDLDLMAVPWRPSPQPPKICFDHICARFRLTPAVGSPYVGLMKSWSHQANDFAGRVIDFQFRKSEVTLEESYEFSMRNEAGPQCAHGNFVGYCAACAGEEVAK